MVRPRNKSSSKQQMSLREQFRAIAKVAALSFRIAPGAVLFKLFGAILNALLPFVTAYFAALTTTTLVEAYSGNESAQSLVVMYVIVTTLIGLFGLAWASVDRYIQANMRFRVEAKVSDRMYEQFLSLDFWRYDDKETVDLYDKAQKFAQFFAYIFDRLATLATQLITMIIGVAALVSLNIWLALAVFAAMVPGIYFQFKLSRAQIEHWNNNIDTRRTRNMIEWNLLQPDAITELRLYGVVRHLLGLRNKMRNKDEKARVDFEKRFIGKRLMADLLQTGAEVGALLWVVVEIIAHRQPIGQFVYVQQVVSRAINGASGLITELSTIDEDIANLFDYEKFMQLERSDEGGIKIKSVAGGIGIDKLTFRYPNQDSDVLKNVTLTVEPNQHVAIVGENGAGKTTLIKLLAGLYLPQKGSVTVDGTALKDIDIASWHKQLAILRQDFVHYIFANIGDNVRFGDVSKQDAELFDQALRDAEAFEFTKKLPRGVDTMANNWMEDEEGNKGVELSGGQWQRLALARNFYRDAPIIILDEPTSAIDAMAEAKIFNRLFKEKNKTIIAISHRLTTVKKADVIYMMKDGEVVESGDYQSLINARGDFYKMFESQL